MGTVRIIASHRCRRLATPRFLEELTELPREFHYPFVYTRMVDMDYVAADVAFDLESLPFRRADRDHLAGDRRRVPHARGAPDPLLELPAPAAPGHARDPAHHDARAAD